MPFEEENLGGPDRSSSIRLVDTAGIIKMRQWNPDERGLMSALPVFFSPKGRARKSKKVENNRYILGIALLSLALPLSLWSVIGRAKTFETSQKSQPLSLFSLSPHLPHYKRIFVSEFALLRSRLNRLRRADSG